MVIPWTGIALLTNAVLGVVLIVRLLSLRLHRVYKVFCAYVVFVLLSPPLVLVEDWRRGLDYRVVYVLVALSTWVFTLWVVSALLGAILAHLPGILKFSRRLLAIVFALATVLAIIMARPEFHHDQTSRAISSIDFAVRLVSPIERVVITVSLLALLAIQGFILWFPVSLPRNLVLFSIGFVFNFVCETVLLVIRGLLPPSASAVIDPVNLFVLTACLLYFSLVITRPGESIPIRLGHIWHSAEQDRLFRQLEQINGALLRSVRN
jgi:hypothetical protein